MAELFKDFEVNRDPRWQVVLRLLGGSVAVHLLLIICVLYIPGVRDAFNIATLIADTSFVDKPYAKTEIGDDVQLVQLSSNKFRYPDGYFALDAGLIPPAAPFIAPPVFTTTAPAPQSAPPPLALPSPSPSATALPSPVPAQSPSQTIAQANARPSSSPKPGADQKQVDQKQTPEQAQAELEKTAAENNVELPKEGEINKKALKDFAIVVNDLKEKGKLDLDKPFEIVVEAELDQNGKLKNPRFTKKAGDPTLVELFGQMISALNDSGFLVLLKPIHEDNPAAKVVFTVKQGESEVLATVESEVSSDDSARLLAKFFNVSLVLGAVARQGKDEEILMKNTSAMQTGKKLIFNFTMPRQAVADLIKKQLAS